MTNRAVLLFAFSFAVMADPVSSVAYAIEAALRALRGDIALLLPTMGLVVAIIAVLVVNYHQLVGRYPQGGGAPAAAAEAFGEASAFIPIAALIVDFALTIAISTAAAASAIIAFFPSLAGLRAPIALLLVAGVAAGTWFGHRGRTVFAVMTAAFVVLAVVVLVCGLFVTPRTGAPAEIAAGHAPPLAVALAFPVAMALATGIEAPSSAIAQLGQLDDAARRKFGRITLWLTLLVVGTLTLGLTAELVHLRIGVPPDDSTQIAELARVATAPPLFAAFQLATALLLLSAASSSFQAGPGLLKALARKRDIDGTSTGILPAVLGRTNSRYTLGRRRVHARCGRDHPGSTRARPGTRAFLRRGGVCGLPRRPSLHVPVFLAAEAVRLSCNQFDGRGRGQFHPRDQCLARGAHHLHRRGLTDRRGVVRAMGAIRAAPGHPACGAHSAHNHRPW
ncbi:amino acid permease [Mycolicibacterium tusciae]|uniref:amino acid permease n=1 Tax=Mycolicibacterium tusciae TaxID=75922 RepID=UPI001F2E92C0|nr:amino acid permease [Mycolicibacterium tusciae]